MSFDPTGTAIHSSAATQDIRGQKRFAKKVQAWLWGALLPVTLLIVWQVLGDKELISPLLFPTPLAIAESFGFLYKSGILNDNLRISISRVAAGFAVGSGLGLLFGFAVGLLRTFERTLDPTVQMIRMVPHLAVTSLFVLWFGIGETSKILLIAKGAFFPIYINAFLGIRNVDNKLFEVTRVLGFSTFTKITRLILPATVPNLFLGIRLSAAISWLSLAVAEMMGATSGIGYLMMDARALSQTTTVFVGIILFTAFGKITDSLILYTERRLLKWQDS